MTLHPHDISAGDLQHMTQMSPEPRLLDAVVAASREILGFFPAHNPRALEYPWILAQLPQDLRQCSILDVGAGVNVVPFLLAQRGATVTTLDHHPVTRDPADRQGWNEWGFLDYALLDRRIRSVRMPYEDWSAAERFDCIYSVSVIEHVARATRLRWIDKLREQLKPRGSLLLTVDLVRGTEMLWNLCEGKTIEDPRVHGEFDTLLSELRGAGFDVASTQIRRDIPNCRVDIGFVRLLAD